MNKKYIFYLQGWCLFSFCLALVSATHLPNTEPPAYQIVKEMFVKSKQIASMKYTMKKQERINGKILMQQTSVKLVSHPLKVYLIQELPKKGLEVLYVQGTNNNHALVNTNGFPWVNLSLDPMGSIMRENQHHTLLDSGYPHLISILEHLTTKYHLEIDKLITNSGLVHWNGHTCWHITFTNPNFKISKHTVQKGETLLTLAAKSKLSEHMILELNKNIDNFADVTPGQIINLPNDYSNKLELFIDKNELIPLMIKVYDDKGLYEHYEYYNVQINPTFQSNEFDRHFPGYNF